MKKLYIVLIILFLTWGIALRAIEVINGNYLFGFDHGRDYLAAYSIAVNHKLTLIGAEVGAGSAGLNGIFHGPGYYYLIALMYVLFRGDPYGSLLLMFLFGVSSLILLIYTARKMFGKAVMLMALFLVGISPLIVSQSRFLWNHHPSTLFIILLFYFVYMIGKKPSIYAPLAVFTAGILYHFELAMAVPLVLSVFIALPVVYRVRDARVYVYCVCAALFAFLPFILFESRHGWTAVRSMYMYLTVHGQTAETSWDFRISDHAGSYISNAVNSFATEHALLPGIYYTWLCAGLAGSVIIFAIRTKNIMIRQFFRYLIVMLAVSYGVLLLLNNSIWDYYLIQAHIAFIYIFSYCFVISFRGIRKSIFAKAAFGVLLLYLLSMIVSSVWRMKTDYTYDLYDYGGVEKIKGKRAAIDYVYSDAGGQPFSEFTFMAPIYTYPYDYLFKTYGKEKYGYIPGSQKSGVVYLIIEPDNSKPWTYKGWLETVIAGGDIIYTRTLPTGHIIQKRIFPI